jgi:hypothetical protein
MKIEPPFDKELLDWYEHSKFKLRQRATELEPLLDEGFKKLKKGEGDSFHILVEQYQHNNLLWIAHVYEEMHSVMMMVNILSIALSGLPDKKALAKYKAQQKKIVKNIVQNRLLGEEDKNMIFWVKRALEDSKKEKVI